MSDFVPAGQPRKAGRPTNAEIAARKAAPPVQASRVEGEKAKRRRRADTSETRNMKLHVPKDQLDPNFVYRFVNDVPGRIHDKTVNDDWEIVAQTSDQVPTQRHVGVEATGASRKAVLLRKPKEYYQEDEDKKQAAISAREEAMRTGVTDSPQGLSGPTTYVPGGVNTISRGR